MKLKVPHADTIVLVFFVLLTVFTTIKVLIWLMTPCEPESGHVIQPSTVRSVTEMPAPDIFAVCGIDVYGCVEYSECGQADVFIWNGERL